MQLSTLVISMLVCIFVIMLRRNLIYRPQVRIVSLPCKLVTESVKEGVVLQWVCKGLNVNQGYQLRVGDEKGLGSQQSSRMSVVK